MTHRIFNFSAGPATLPLEVLEKAQGEFLNFQNSGMSVMEMSHRSKEFMAILSKTKDAAKQILSIPDTHEILFLQGGASLQFSMIPMNLALPGKSIDVINTGAWTKKAIAEFKRESSVSVLATSEDKNFSYIPNLNNVAFNSDASFAYITTNNTIFGTQYFSYPDTGNVPLVADMSSDIFCHPVDVSKFGLIFAGAQKNLGPSGVTIVIINKELANRAPNTLPTMLQYRTHIQDDSLYNTPPTFGIYMIGLVLEWIQNKGGIHAIQKQNQDKAQLLYDAIDSSPFYYSPTDKASRSLMNVVFRITGDKEDLESKFVQEATKAGLSGLKGHRSVGGLRASIYNAHPVEGVQALVDFMKKFESENA